MLAGPTCFSMKTSPAIQICNFGMALISALKQRGHSAFLWRQVLMEEAWVCVFLCPTEQGLKAAVNYWRRHHHPCRLLSSLQTANIIGTIINIRNSNLGVPKYHTVVLPSNMCLFNKKLDDYQSFKFLYWEQ